MGGQRTKGRRRHWGQRAKAGRATYLRMLVGPDEAVWQSQEAGWGQPGSALELSFRSAGFRPILLRTGPMLGGLYHVYGRAA
jgi:hypothetical protein